MCVCVCVCVCACACACVCMCVNVSIIPSVFNSVYCKNLLDFESMYIFNISTTIWIRHKVKFSEKFCDLNSE